MMAVEFRDVNVCTCAIAAASASTHIVGARVRHNNSRTTAGYAAAISFVKVSFHSSVGACSVPATHACIVLSSEAIPGL